MATECVCRTNMHLKCYQRALDAAKAEAIERAAQITWPDGLMVWSNEERDGMARVFSEASKKHGHYETLFAVVAYILRRRRDAIRALAAPKQAEQGMACMVPADDNSGRRCNKPTGHDGDHWTYGGATKTWPQEPASRLCKCERYFVPCPVCVPKQAEQPDHEFVPEPLIEDCCRHFDEIAQMPCGLSESAHRRAEEKR